MSGANEVTEFKDVVGTLDELRALMGEPSEIALRKDIGRLDEHCRAFIARAPFVLVATADRAGRCDVSPKGDAPGFVLVVDDRTLLVPDRPGNKRFDGMRNLLENPGIGLLFLVPGSEETLRVNGRARIVRDAVWLARLAAQGKTPQLAIAVDVEESFLHCAKCVKRSGLWETDRWPGPHRPGLAGPDVPRPRPAQHHDRRGARPAPAGRLPQEPVLMSRPGRTDMAPMPIEVRPITGALGAEIHGVDLEADLDAASVAAIRRVLLDHCVVFFRDQRLDAAQQKALARCFGEIFVHPNYATVVADPEIIEIRREPGDLRIVGEEWHTDTTMMAEPPMGAILYAIDVPPYGGDTLFASQYLAYEALSDGMKRLLEGLRAVHSDRKVAGPQAGMNAYRATKVREES